MANNTIKLFASDADDNAADPAFPGDGAAVSSYFWGISCELGSYFSSYIKTEASAVTRNKDELEFKGDDGNIANNLQGSLFCKSLSADYDKSSNGYLWTLSDGGSAADRVNMVIKSIGDTPQFLTEGGGGNTGDVNATTDVIDGAIHSFRGTWKADSVKAYVDNIQEGSEDTTADMPNDLDEIAIAQDRAQGVQLNGLISEVKIFNINSIKG